MTALHCAIVCRRAIKILTHNDWKCDKDRESDDDRKHLNPLILTVIVAFPVIVVFLVIVIFPAFWGQNEPFLGSQEYCPPSI